MVTLYQSPLQDSVRPSGGIGRGEAGQEPGVVEGAQTGRRENVRRSSRRGPRAARGGRARGSQPAASSRNARRRRVERRGIGLRGADGTRADVDTREFPECSGPAS